MDHLSRSPPHSHKGEARIHRESQSKRCARHGGPEEHMPACRDGWEKEWRRSFLRGS